MRIVFEVDSMLTALQPMMQLVNRKNTMPILDCVEIAIQEEGRVARLTCSDMDNELTTYAPLTEVEGGCTFCTDVSLFNQILSKLKGRSLTLSTHEGTNKLRGTYEGGEFDIVLDDADAFPHVLSKLKDTSIAQVESASSIALGLNKTFYAVASDELRPTLTGVYFDFTPSGLTFVGTDGRALVKFVNKAQVYDGFEDKSFIVPKKACGILRTLLVGYDIPMTMAITPNNVVFYNDAFIFACRLIEGKFPNYEKVIAISPAHFTYVNRKNLIDTLSRLSLFAPQSELIIMKVAKGVMELSCQDIDYSISAKETMPCRYEGKGIVIGMKCSLLQNALQNIDSEEVIFEMESNNKAALLKPCEVDAGCENTEHIILIMPMITD